MTPRIAVVEHGDALEARRLRAAGAPEPYTGMHYSQGFIDNWLAGRPHLIISLNAPRYRENEGEGILVGLPEPEGPRRVPGTLRHLFWAGEIIGELRRFRPTHFLLRTGTLLAATLLRAAIRYHWQTLAMFAGVFANSRRYDRFVTSQIIRHLHHPLVFAAGNHRQPATDSMIDAGLNPRKAVAWEYEHTHDPADFPFKQLANGPIEVVYAGVMSHAKGVGEIIDAVAAVRAGGRDVSLTLCGSGPDLAELQSRAASLGPAANFLGRVGNDEVFRRMAGATFVCVPSRHEFPEGFPHTLTEAMTVHTPILASDHPVFTRVLKDGEGLRYFPARDSAALARLLTQLAEQPAEYERLSQQTTAAYKRLQCPVLFHQVIQSWLP
jgi:glycosyltransferase involved in cell wall biosynthesis